LPRKKRYRSDGTRVINAASRTNALVKRGVHGNGKHLAYSKLFAAKIDKRLKLGKLYAGINAVYTSQMGGEDNIPPFKAVLKEHAVRLTIMCHQAWVQMLRTGGHREDGSAVPAHDVYTRTLARLQSLLESLGLERTEKEVLTLAEYIASKDTSANVEDAEVVEE
jgi:hypothetical protein